MTEFFFIITQFFIIYFLLSFNICVINAKNQNLKNFSLIENISFNTIIFLNFILIVSFFNVSLNIIIKSYLIYLSFLILFYLYKFKNLFVSAKESWFYFILLFFTSIVIFLEVANNLVIGWDAQKFWIYKTINFFNGNSITELSNLPNAWYPYLGSLSWSFFWKISFLEHEYSGRLFYVFIYLSSLFLLVNNFNFSKLYKTIFFILLIIISYDYTYHSHWSMFSGYQEILIFSLVCMAMHFFYKLLNSNKDLGNFHIISILLICNLLVWIKHEGFIISLSLILTLIFFFNFEIRKKIFILSVYLFIIFLRFFIFDFYDLNPDEVQHQGYENLQLMQILGKISLQKIFIIFQSLIMNLFSNYLILMSIFLLSIFLFIKKNINKIFYIIFFAVFNIAVFFGIYLISDLEVTFMLKTSMDRILYQLSPFAILIFLEIYNSKNFLKLN